MCGILGYVGNGNASDFLIEGLRRLEYRGYDSAGIAVYENGKIEIEKKAGRLVNLEKAFLSHRRFMEIILYVEISVSGIPDGQLTANHQM